MNVSYNSFSIGFNLTHIWRARFKLTDNIFTSSNDTFDVFNTSSHISNLEIVFKWRSWFGLSTVSLSSLDTCNNSFSISQNFRHIWRTRFELSEHILTSSNNTFDVFDTCGHVIDLMRNSSSAICLSSLNICYNSFSIGFNLTHIWRNRFKLSENILTSSDDTFNIFNTSSHVTILELINIRSCFRLSTVSLSSLDVWYNSFSIS